MPIFIILGILAAIAFALISMYNSLIVKKNNVESAFSGMDVMLKKRYDLIPNLVETVKAYMTHEKDLLVKVTELRARAMNPNVSADDKVELNNQISQTMGGIMVAVENYPDIKANQNFLKLQDSWEDIEDEISGARVFYNSTVLVLNNAIEMFPSNIVANMMSLKIRKFFEAPEEQRENIDAKALFGNK